MMPIHPCAIPGGALLNRYDKSGHYADCFYADIDAQVSIAKFVTAFYTSWVFKLERLILKFAIEKPSTDVEAEQVAIGRRELFAAWSVEDRTERELLMCALRGRTRSWFMVVPQTAGGGRGTRLLFGSAVVPRKNPKTGKTELSAGYVSLLGIHRLYSKILLAAARSRVRAWR